MSPRVAAIVVTYDRPEQLRECLAALDRQSRSVDHVYVVDNRAGELGQPLMRTEDAASTLRLSYLMPPTNLGGAGGFCLGLEHAYSDGFEWFWLVDDDAIPADGALEALLAAHERMPASDKPVLLASLITGTDGRPHPRHTVIYKREHDRRQTDTIAALGYANIRRADFVSVLIARRAVTRYGYPIADYFIWGDDLEYTSRILRRERGLFVPDSIVCHATSNGQPRSASTGRLFLFARNYLWMLLYSSALTIREKVGLTARYAIVFAGYVVRHRGRLSSWMCIAQGFAAALMRRPRQSSQRAAEPTRRQLCARDETIAD